MKFYFFKFLIFLFLIFLFPLGSSAHYVIGQVNNALDGENANDKVVILWNPSVGMQDNLTDIIGVNGNSFTSSYYMIDCELLNTACQPGDNLSVKVLDSGDQYVSEIGKITISLAGYSLLDNLTLNSFPNVSLISPFHYSYLNYDLINFTCEANDLDGNLNNISLYGNWSSGWHLNETKSVSGTSDSVTFSKYLPEGSYIWDCLVKDNLSVSDFSESAYHLEVDRTKPSNINFTINETGGCESSNVSIFRAICSTNDLSGIKNVTLEVSKQGFLGNYTMNFLSQNDYYLDLNIDVLGDWNFACYSEDLASNFETSFLNRSFLSSLPDFAINFLNVTSPSRIEFENVTIESQIVNLGCTQEETIVSFFENDPSLGNQIGNNLTLNLSYLENSTIFINWPLKIGSTDIFVSIDEWENVLEYNESNNVDKTSLFLSSWQEFYGSVSSIKRLSGFLEENFTTWGVFSPSGNIFVTDMESSINWLELKPLGIDLSQDFSPNDFSEADLLLGMDSYNDSINKTFLEGGFPLEKTTFSLYGLDLENVSIINSTNNGNFITGILWDSSDSLDNQFDQTDKEDLVFVSKINKNLPGDYGTYDYELVIPVKLREYDPSNNKEVYFYYDLV